MSTIFIDPPYVLSDTNHYKGSEQFYSLSKLNALSGPCRLVVKEAWGTGTNWKGLTDIDATIYGYGICGSNAQANALISRLTDFYVKMTDEISNPTSGKGLSEKFSNQLINWWEVTFAFLNEVQLAGFVNDDTSYIVQFYGIKEDYELTVDTSELSFKVLSRKYRSAMGSGARQVIGAISQTEDPIRAMYAAVATDRHTKGFIDIWTLPTEENPKFKRYGICDNRSPRVAAMLSAGTPDDRRLLPDWISHDFIEEKINEIETLVIKSRRRSDQLIRKTERLKQTHAMRVKKLNDEINQLRAQLPSSANRKRKSP